MDSNHREPMSPQASVYAGPFPKLPHQGRPICVLSQPKRGLRMQPGHWASDMASGRWLWVASGVEVLEVRFQCQPGLLPEPPPVGSQPSVAMPLRSLSFHQWPQSCGQQTHDSRERHTVYSVRKQGNQHPRKLIRISLSPYLLAL